MEKDILTAKEAALFLSKPRYTIYYQVLSGYLPGFKEGGQWRFKKSEIDSWNKKAPSLPAKTLKRPR